MEAENSEYPQSGFQYSPQKTAEIIHASQVVSDKINFQDEKT